MAAVVEHPESNGERQLPAVSFKAQDVWKALPHVAGRFAVGQNPPITLTKGGSTHIRLHETGSTTETVVLGGACSECFSGPRLAQILRRGHEYEARVLAELAEERPAEPLSIHTSAGTAPALGEFVAALAPHLPSQWGVGKDNVDWFLSLQLEGGSAVLAAFDLLLQLQVLKGNSSVDTSTRIVAAVSEHSYHGPAGSHFGTANFLGTKHNQIFYPSPCYRKWMPAETEDEFCHRMRNEFADFIAKHGKEVAVLLIEPQSGSSLLGQLWPGDLLREYVDIARAAGILVCADEIMCGLGRHGQGTTFLVDALGCTVDAVTFGKAIAGGAFALSGVAVRQGASLLGAAGHSVLQSHTYAHGAHMRALMAATDMLKLLPEWLAHVTHLGDVCKQRFAEMEVACSGAVKFHGQGLMWGGVFVSDDMTVLSEASQVFDEECLKGGVNTYTKKREGFILSPVLDISESALRHGLDLLELCIRRTLERVPKWVPAQQVR